MSPLMQTICDYLCEYCLNRYIDGFVRNTCSAELDRLHNALSAALPESQRDLLDEYEGTLNLCSYIDIEAMFQAAFAAARELG